MQRQQKRPENLNVGIYCRLSKDDGNLGVSGSIQNQREFLTDYVIKNGWNLVNIYIDDGYSGTNFDRPGFQKLISDVERKKINCVITKDLSRLGRNYVKSGYYIEEYFPRNNIRYIAVNDNYDTEIEANNDFGPFKNIINEWYAKDISKKVKFSLHAMQKRGDPKRVAHVLYGYMQDQNGVRIPDPVTGPVIRKIFEIYVETKSTLRVVEYLKENKIYCPAYHQYTVSGYMKHIFDNCDEERKYKWNNNVVRSIISNQEYLGHYITHKQERLSFKLKITRRCEETYLFKNKYEPLVTEELFLAANKIKDVYREKFKEKDDNIFQKLLYCETCGKRLCFHVKDYIKSDYSKARYYCRNNACSEHAYIPKVLITEIVTKEIKSICEYILSNKDAFVRFAINYTNDEELQKQVIEQNNNEALLEKKAKLEKYIEGAFKAKLEGDLTEDMYHNIVTGYKNELSQIIQKLSFQAPVEKFVDYENEARYFIESLESIADFDELTTDIVATFCDAIYVKTIKENRVAKEYKVRICFGPLDDCIKGFLNHEC